MGNPTTVNEGKSNRILFANTFAFTICFAAWLINGVLVTYLVDNQVFNWSVVEIGWLLGIPVLTGAIFRLPAGILTDKFGGRPVHTILLFLCAVPMFLLSFANSYWAFALCSFGFGLAGTSFAIGIAYTAIWFPKEKQGTALGIFGAGNAGAAITTLFAPTILKNLTNDGTNMEGWRILPIIYASVLVLTAILFYFLTENKKPESSKKTLKTQLKPLKNIRVWRFGMYYFLVFGCFVAFAQWLVPYFVNVYAMPLVTAGILASAFSLPSGVIRALGGWMSDKFGARKVMYWVLGISVVVGGMLIIPKMDIMSPGKGIMAKQSGEVTFVSNELIKVGEKEYPLVVKEGKLDDADKSNYFLPAKESWQEPAVKVGDIVTKKQLLAKGVTHIFFQANVWIFAVLVILLGSVWGIGKAAVYKHIPDYFPNEVGVVGGMVGVLGGLGGFVCPIIFGYLLDGTGLWSSCWMFVMFASLICLVWMHSVIQKMMNKKAPTFAKEIEEKANNGNGLSSKEQEYLKAKHTVEKLLKDIEEEKGLKTYVSSVGGKGLSTAIVES